MNTSILLWLFLRALRWLSWIAFLVWSVYFHFDRAPHLNSFGHLLLRTEMMFFGLATLAVFSGFFETMMRDRAGLARTRFGELIPSSASEPLREGV